CAAVTEGKTAVPKAAASRPIFTTLQTMRLLRDRAERLLRDNEMHSGLPGDRAPTSVISRPTRHSLVQTARARKILAKGKVWRNDGAQPTKFVGPAFSHPKDRARMGKSYDRILVEIRCRRIDRTGGRGGELVVRARLRYHRHRDGPLVQASPA